MSLPKVVLQVLIAASLAVSGVVHAYLYITGYREVSMIGPAFLWQASLFCALAVLILIGGPGWLQVLAALGAAASLVAFALSRTVGLFGFTETGWEPTPYTWLALVAELLTVALVGAAFIRSRVRAGRTHLR